MDNHAEKVAEILVLKRLVADHQAALPDHPLLDEGWNLKQPSTFYIIVVIISNPGTRML